MKRLLALFLAGVSAPALAQSPSPAQMGMTPTTPEVLQVLDASKAWASVGTVDPTRHIFGGYGAAGTDVRSYGCFADGSTDQAACLNYASANAPDCALVPASVAGFYVAPGSTVSVGKCLRGTAFSAGYSTPYPAVFAGRSWIKCGGGAGVACVQSTSDGAYIGDLSIATAFPGAAGSIGLQILKGYNSQLRDVAVSGFDQCAYWGPIGPSAGGISSRAIGLYLSWCQTNYAVQDGWPELYIADGRWGANGQGTVTPWPKAMVYVTKSLPGSAGAGPNSLTMIHMQVNPGGGKVQCMVKFGSFTGAVPSSGGWRQFKFIGNHWEFLAPTPDATKPHGAFCADDTVDNINQLYVAQSEFGFDGHGGGGAFALSQPFTADTTIGSTTLANVGGLDGPASFSIKHGQYIIAPGVPSGSYFVSLSGSTATFDNPTHAGATATAAGVAMTAATGITNMEITSAFFGVDDTTMVFTPGGLISTPSQWVNTFFGGPLHITGDTSARLSLSNNVTGPATIDGTWGRLTSSFDQFSSLDDGAARGSIAIATALTNQWTPVVDFGGAPSTLAYVTSGLMQRTSGGGFTANFLVTKPATGTEGSHGALTITGLPYKCGSLFLGDTPYVQNNFTPGTGHLVLRPDSTDPVNIDVMKAGSTGLSSVVDTDLAAGAMLGGTINCGSAL